MANVEKITKVAVSRTVGFLIFVLILFVLNLMSNYIGNTIFQNVVLFLKANFMIILMMSVFFLIADIVYYIYFPIDLLTPLFNALASFFLVMFIFNVFSFIDANVTNGELSDIQRFYPVVFIVVIICVLVFGYISVTKRALRHGLKRRKYEKEDNDDNDTDSENPDYEEEDFNEEEDESEEKKKTSVKRKLKSRKRK